MGSIHFTFTDEQPENIEVQIESAKGHDIIAAFVELASIIKTDLNADPQELLALAMPLIGESDGD